MAGGAKRISILNHLEKEIGKWDKDVKQEASTIQTPVVERRNVRFLASSNNCIKELKPVHVPRRKRRRKPKLWFVLELMHDERTDPSMYHSTEGLVCSSQALSWTNENIRLRVRFRPGTLEKFLSMSLMYLGVIVKPSECIKGRLMFCESDECISLAGSILGTTLHIPHDLAFWKKKTGFINYHPRGFFKWAVV